MVDESIDESWIQPHIRDNSPRHGSFNLPTLAIGQTVPHDDTTVTSNYNVRRMRRSSNSSLEAEFDQEDEDDSEAIINLLDNLAPAFKEYTFINAPVAMAAKITLCIVVTALAVFLTILHHNLSRATAAVAIVQSLSVLLMLSMTLTSGPSARTAASCVAGLLALVTTFCMAVLPPSLFPLPIVAFELCVCLFYSSSAMLVGSALSVCIGVTLNIPLDFDRPTYISEIGLAGLMCVLSAALMTVFRARVSDVGRTLDETLAALRATHLMWLEDLKASILASLDPLSEMPTDTRDQHQQVACVLRLLDSFASTTTDMRHLRVIRLCQARVDQIIHRNPTKEDAAASFISSWTGHGVMHDSHDDSSSSVTNSIGRTVSMQRVGHEQLPDHNERFSVLLAQTMAQDSSGTTSVDVSDGRQPQTKPAGAGGRKNSSTSQVDFEGAVFEALSTFLDWGFDTQRHNDALDGRALQVVLCAAVDYFNYIETFNIPMDLLQSLLAHMLSRYEPHPFHNSVRAALVVHSTFWIVANVQVASVLTDLDIISLLFAAAIGDLGHSGVTNSFLCDIEAFLAVRYNDWLPNEFNALANFFELTARPDCAIFSNLPAAQRKEIRDTVITLVLTTTSSNVSSVANDLDARIDAGLESFGEKYSERVLLLQAILCIAHLSNHMLPINLYRAWNERAFEQRLIQGDLQAHLGMVVGPFSDRTRPDPEGSQHSFFKFLVEPLLAVSTRVMPELAALHPLVEANKCAYKPIAHLHTAIDRAREPRMALYPHGLMGPAERVAQLMRPPAQSSRVEVLNIPARMNPVEEMGSEDDSSIETYLSDDAVDTSETLGPPERGH
ncbi:3'5'-cyclic nucleotide phosphodiesterase [Carpediemonas membranifera]|uniref:3'5'-cyclic nucleotide phosphodiesterase n=1 Tax=Carpediemonas membranifera TaxID=201153 RepID=A0A8J6AZC6_9EUKA|nr:3'5'-cyclic nucleotide phosphodiesterase [Carpediemonas membranifera]|eukprot:KAG9395100.1 3'5'-cyclic nucleotide phosphodiesterase [Carpediemonas membranifera]